MSERINVRLFGIAIVALLVGIAIGYFIPRPAQVEPTISLSTASVSAGTQFTATMSGFPANTEIYGWVVNENPPRMFRVGVTDAQGKLTASADAPQAAGTWLLCASDQDYQYWATTVLIVT